MRRGLLSWEQYRYFKWALLLGGASIALYASQGIGSAQPPNGGTWQGYVLGTAGALLIAWLSALGIRKRSYRSTLGTVQGWTSAHVYLGALLLLVATLHCAAQFGLNVHTLAYALTCLVVVSGCYGLYAYVHLPGRTAANSAGKDQAQWLGELAALDVSIRDLLVRCDANLQTMALSALELTRLGGTVGQQLSARDRSTIVLPVEEGGSGKPVANVGQAVMIETLSRRIPDTHKETQAEVLNELLALFGRRQFILQLLRRDIRLKGLLKIWLYCHIPLTLALLVALAIHILVVFIYW